MRKGWMVLFFLSSMLAGAETTEGLTVEAAVKEALTANLGLRAEGQRLEVKTRDKDWSFQKFFPTVTAGAGWSRFNDTSTQARLVGFNGSQPVIYQPDQQNVGLSAGAQFTLNLGTFAQMKQTLADWDLGRTDYEMTRQKLTAQVKKTFYLALSLQETRKVLESEVENAQTRWTELEARYKSGSGPELDLLQGGVALENRKNELRSLDLVLNQTGYAFALLLGRTPGDPVVLTGEIDPALPSTALDGAKIAGRYLPKRLDLAQIEAQKNSLDALASLVSSEALPQFVVGYTADPFVNAPQNTDLLNGSNWHQNQGAWSLQLQWKLDAFLPGSSFWTELADLKNLKTSLDLDKKQAFEAGRMEILNLCDQVEKSTEVLVSLQKNSEAASRAEVLAQKAFSAGVLNLTGVQDASLQAQSARLSLLNEKLTLKNSLIDLETALNTPLEEVDELK